MISAITIIDNFIFTVISMLRALPSCSHFMTTAKPHSGNLCGERLDHRRDVILRLRCIVFGWLGVKKYFSGKLLALQKKLSICGNCYFILTLLGVCHETVNFFCLLTIIFETSMQLNITCHKHGHVQVWN